MWVPATPGPWELGFSRAAKFNCLKKIRLEGVPLTVGQLRLVAVLGGVGTVLSDIRVLEVGRII